jgi:hypothetical protein
MALWKRFEDMESWKKSCRLACDVYRLTNEGRFERDSSKAFANHVSVARGSAGELRTQLYLACKLGYVSAGRTRELVARAKEVSRMATGLIGRLRKAESD